MTAMAASYAFTHLPLTCSSNETRANQVGHGHRMISRSRFLPLHQELQMPKTGAKTWRGGAVVTASSAVNEMALQEVKVKIKVGPVRSLSERVYKFQKIFGPSSSIVVVTLPKPLGIVFVESPLKNAHGKNRIMVGELVVGGNADRASRVAQLFVGRNNNNYSNVQSNLPIVNGGVMPGDILRATTTAGVVVDFFGIRRPQRVMDLYIADGRPWHLVMRALNASYVADGELTLVFERRNTNS